MKTITNLIVQVRNKDKVNLYLDDAFFCSIMLETAMKHNLKKGMIIDEKVLENLILESEKSLAFNSVLKLVSVRYKTKKEVERYLQEKQYAPNVIYYCIKKLGEYNFIDDERYCESYVAHHIQKDGFIKIKQQLLIKGVSEEIINKTFEKYDNQNEQIEKYMQKYMRNKEGTKENFAKCFKHLLSKGFKADEILSVMKNTDLD